MWLELSKILNFPEDGPVSLIVTAVLSGRSRSVKHPCRMGATSALHMAYIEPMPGNSVIGPIIRVRSIDVGVNDQTMPKIVQASENLPGTTPKGNTTPLSSNRSAVHQVHQGDWGKKRNVLRFFSHLRHSNGPGRSGAASEASVTATSTCDVETPPRARQID